MLYQQNKKHHEVLPIQFIFFFFNVCFDISCPSLDFGSPRFPEMYGIGSLATSSHRPPMIGHGRATPFLELHTEVHHRKAGVGGKNKMNACSVPDHLEEMIGDALCRYDTNIVIQDTSNYG